MYTYITYCGWKEDTLDGQNPIIGSLWEISPVKPC